MSYTDSATIGEEGIGVLSQFSGPGANAPESFQEFTAPPVEYGDMRESSIQNIQPVIEAEQVSREYQSRIDTIDRFPIDGLQFISELGNPSLLLPTSSYHGEQERCGQHNGEIA